MSLIPSYTLLEELENKSPDLAIIKKNTCDLETLLLSDPKNFEILKNLGHCYQIQSSLAKAHDYYQQALHIQVEDGELWYGIGLMYFNTGNFQYAEPSFLKVLSISEDFPQRFSVNFKLGLIFKRYSLYKDSVIYFKKCLEGNKKGETLQQLGFCYNKLGQKPEALSSFTESHETSKSPYSALSLAWFLSGSEINSAFRYLSEGLTLCKKDSFEELDLLYALARIHHRNRDLPQASSLYLQVLNRNSSDVQVLNSFGVLCAETGQTGQAFRCFTRASELSSKSWEVWNNIGCLYWNSGQPNESKIAFDKAKQFSSSSEKVQQKTKEFVFFDFDVSELPFVKRSQLKEKEEKVEIPKPQTTAPSFAYQQNVINGYAAIGWYLNIAKQFSAIQIARQRFEEDKKAAEILTDLSTVIPKKRKRDTKDPESPKDP